MLSTSELTSRALVAITLSAALTACGGDDSGGFFDPEELDPNGTLTSYVVDGVVVPANAADATAVGLDLDGDGNADNQLGRALATVAGFSADVDIQGAVDQGIASGTTIILAQLQATSLTNATGAGMFFHLGENPSNDPCSGPDDMICGGHLDGSTSFDIAANSPSDTLVVGSIAGGKFKGGPGTVTLEIAVVDGVAPLLLNLIGARVEVTVSESGLMSGRLAGGITEDEVQNNALPAVRDILLTVAGPDCTAEAPPCCIAESSGALIYELFNANDDCDISVEEISSSPLISAFLAPDVDLLDENGDFAPGSDEVLDSLSIGVGFSATTADF